MYQKIFKSILINFLLIFANTTATTTQNLSTITLAKIAAIINDNIILISDIQNISQQTNIKKIHENEKKLQKNNTTLYNNTIEQLIIDELIFQLATKLNIKIDDYHLNKIINDIANQNHITTKELFDILYKNNITYNSYKAYIHKKTIINEFSNYKMQQQIYIFPEEINKKIKTITKYVSNNLMFQLKHISIMIPNNPNTQQKKLAQLLAINIIESNNDNEKINKIITNNAQNKIQIKQKQISGKLQELPKFVTENLIKIQQGNISKLIYYNNNIDILIIDNVYLNNKKIYGIEMKTKQIFLENSQIKNNKKTYELLKNISENIKNKQISFDNAIEKISDIYPSKNKNQEIYNNIEDFEPNIRNKLIILQKQETSEPIRTNYGWHLIQIIDIYNANNIQSILKNYAYDILYKEKFTEEMQNWIIELRNNSYIKNLINIKNNCKNDY